MPTRALCEDTALRLLSSVRDGMVLRTHELGQISFDARSSDPIAGRFSFHRSYVIKFSPRWHGWRPHSCVRRSTRKDTGVRIVCSPGSTPTCPVVIGEQRRTSTTAGRR